MGNENENSSSSTKTETVTNSSNDSEKLAKIEKQLQDKQTELNELKKNSGIEISNLKKEAQNKENQKKGNDSKPAEEKPKQLKENLGTRNNVIKGNPGFNNAYDDGSYKKAVEKLKEKEELAKRGKVAKKN